MISVTLFSVNTSTFVFDICLITIKEPVSQMLLFELQWNIINFNLTKSPGLRFIEWNQITNIEKIFFLT